MSVQLLTSESPLLKSAVLSAQTASFHIYIPSRLSLQNKPETSHGINLFYF